MRACFFRKIFLYTQKGVIRLKKILSYLFAFILVFSSVLSVPVKAESKLETRAVKHALSILYSTETGHNNLFQRNYANYLVTKKGGMEIGAASWYGNNAKELITYIQKNKSTSKYDKNVCKKILANWEDVKAGKKYKKEIIRLINSKTGRILQDSFTKQKIRQYFKEAQKLGVNKLSGKIMSANIIHQAGTKALKRVLKKAKKPYTCNSIYKAMKSDSSNQVGTYKTRQNFVKNILSILPY